MCLHGPRELFEMGKNSFSQLPIGLKELDVQYSSFQGGNMLHLDKFRKIKFK